MKQTLLLTFLLLGLLASGRAFSDPCKKLIDDAFNQAKEKAVLQQYELGRHKFQSLGLEFEGSISDRLNYEDIANRIVKILSLKGINSSIGSFLDPITKTTEYYVNFTTKGEKKRITILDDSSLIKTSGYLGVEITSPIMIDNEDSHLFLYILQELVRLRVLKTHAYGGIHVHYGTKNLKASELSFLLKFFYLNDQYLRDKFKIFPSRHFVDRGFLIKAIAHLGEARPEALAKDIVSKGNFDSTLVKYNDSYETFELKVFNSSTGFNDHFMALDFTVELLFNLFKSQEIREAVNRGYSGADTTYIKKEEARVIDPYLQGIFDMLHQGDHSVDP